MKYYKLVSLQRKGDSLVRKSLYDEELGDLSVEYRPLQEVKTKDGSPLFVLADINIGRQILSLSSEYYDDELWECEGEKSYSYFNLPELKYSLEVQPYSVFLKSVTLTKFIC